jgi:hypothetical protein
MTEELEGGPEFSVDCAAVIANILTCVLAHAVEIAVVPDRLKIDSVSATARLEALEQKLLREAKSVFSEGIPYSLEAKGVTEAITIIEWVCRCTRDQI